MHLERVGPYYSPSGKKREEIKQEIRDAIKKDPTKDPCVVIEGELVQTGREHLDYVVILMELIHDGVVSGSPGSGWIIKSDEGVKTDTIAEYRKTLQTEQENKPQPEYEKGVTGAEELLLQIVANPTVFSPVMPAEMMLDEETDINRDHITEALVGLLADDILSLNENGSYTLDLYASGNYQPPTSGS